MRRNDRLNCFDIFVCYCPALNSSTHFREPEVEVDCASNGKEALQLMNKKYYDLVITDYDMPVMDGSNFLRVMKSKYPGKHTIGITSDMYEEQLYKAGADICIHKPFTIFEVNSPAYKFIDL